MPISASAKSNHDQLFGDRVSTLAQADPELIEYFDNFAFGEVPADAARLDETLGLDTRLMVQLAAILAGYRVALLAVGSIATLAGELGNGSTAIQADVTDRDSLVAAADRVRTIDSQSID